MSTFRYWLLAVLIGKAAIAAPSTFVIDDPKKAGFAEFTSSAPLEQIVGKTGEIYGSFSVDPTNLNSAVSGTVRVVLDSLHSGVNKRDEHMKSEHFLDVANHPFAEFSLDSLSHPGVNQLDPGKPADVCLYGKFSVHGLTKNVVVIGKATYFNGDDNLAKLGFPGNIISFDGKFSIQLADYEIKRPQMLFMKLSEGQDIHIFFTATTGRSPIGASK